MKKITSRWVPHQLSDEQKRDFVVKIWRIFAMVSGDYVILLHMMRHGFTIGNPSHKSTNASCITEGESLTIVAGRDRFEPKTLFSIFFKSKGLVLIHPVDKYKTVDHSC